MTRETKNIVVVGASFAGHSVVNHLAGSISDEYRILLVDRSEFSLHIPGIVRACVVPGWEDKNLTVKLTDDAIFPRGSRHRVIAPNAVVELKRSSIILEKEFEGSNEVFFEKCILALGALQAEPMRPRPGATDAEFKAMLRDMQAGFAAASSILIVGGGSVGIEVAGELSTQYPEKKVTIVHTEEGLLHPVAGAAAATAYVPPPTDPRIGDSLMKQLCERGVDVRLNTRAELGEGQRGALGGLQSIPLASGEHVDADYIFVSIGNKPNSGLVAAADAGALTSNGYVVVDNRFRVVPGSAGSPLAGEYYALGDVADVKSWKTCVAALEEGSALGGVIVAELRGQQPKGYTPPELAPLLVTLGTRGGAGQLPIPLWGLVSAPGFVVGMKNKDLFIGRAFLSRFRGAQKIPS